MSTSDALLLTLALVVAVRSLVSLMRERRDRLVAEVQQQINAERTKPKPKKKAA